MKRNDIFGLSAALVTPFQQSGEPDLRRVAQHAKFVISGGCNSVTLFGTTGEGYGISLRERREIQAAVADALGADAQINVGVTASGIADAAQIATTGYDDGAQRLLFAPPTFMKNLDDDGLFDWYSAVFDRIGAPLKGVILYHIPSVTAVPLSVALISRLREAFPGVITGIKDSSGDSKSNQKFLEAHGDISVLVGDERLLPEAMANGAEGAICGAANFMPQLMQQIVHEGADGRAVTEIVNLVAALPVTPAVKVLTAHVSGDETFLAVRPPLCMVPAHLRKPLTKGFDAIMASAQGS